MRSGWSPKYGSTETVLDGYLSNLLMSLCSIGASLKDEPNTSKSSDTVPTPMAPFIKLINILTSTCTHPNAENAATLLHDMLFLAGWLNRIIH